jgi:uridylate kinase
MKAIFLKLSGERLSKGGELWHEEAVNQMAAKIADVYKKRQDLNIGGITLISGAGNIARGENLEHIFGEYADAIGRLAIIKNTVALSVALEKLDIPNVMMLTDKMELKDVTLKLEKYSPELVKQSFKDGKIVLIAGGTGEDNKTTDNAVVFYAKDYGQASSDEAVILKGTQVDGVYTADPRQAQNAKRFKVIGAKQMLEDYESFKVVDRHSLEQLAASPHLSMFIFKEDKQDLEAVLEHDPRDMNSEGLGTIIVSDLKVPILY